MFRSPSISAALRAIAVAAVYIALARFSFLFTIEQGISTPIWLASGVALAAVVAVGAPGVFGVWIGAFVSLFAQLNSDTTTDAMTSAAFATGALMQACVGAWMLKRYVLERRTRATPAGRPDGLSKRLSDDPARHQARRQDPVKPLLLAFGVLLPASLVGPTITVASLFLGAYVEPVNLTTTWLVWWFGNLCGLLLVAPGALLLFRYSLSRRHELGSAYVVLALGAVGAGIVGWSIETLHQHRLWVAQQQEQIGELSARLTDLVDEQTRRADAVAALVLSSEYVSRSEFAAFAGQVLGRQERIAQAIAFAPRVAQGQRPQWEIEARAEGVLDYMIRDQGKDGAMVPAAQRAEYFPLHLIEPREEISLTTGFDLASDTQLGDALARARDTGRQALSGPSRQLNSAGWSVAVIRPVYRQDIETGTLEQRRTALIGHAMVLIRPQGMLEKIIQDRRFEGHEIAIFAVDPDATFRDSRDHGPLRDAPLIAGSLGDRTPGEPEWQQGFHVISHVDFDGQRWGILARPSDHALTPPVTGFAWALLATGLFAAGTVMFRTRLQFQANTALDEERAKLHVRVEEKTAAHAQAEQQARIAEETLRSAIDAIPEGLVIYDANDRLVIANKRFRELYSKAAPHLIPGASFEELVRKAFADGQFPHAKGDLEPWIARRIARFHQAQGDFEEALVDDRWVRITERKIANGMTVSIRTEITDLKRENREARLEAAGYERKFQDAIAAMPEAFVMVDELGSIVEWSGASEAMFGYTRDEVIGRELGELIVPRVHRERHRNGMRRYLESRDRHLLRREMEQVAMHRSGSEFPVSVRLVSYQTPEGWRLLGFIEDITERKKAEESLKSSEQRYRRLFDSTSAAILIQQGSQIVGINQTACTILGASRDELMKTPVADLIAPEFLKLYMQRYRETFAAIEDRDELPLEIRVRGKPGEARWLSVAMNPFVFGDVPAVLVTGVDVTERKKVEENFAQAQKMEAIGQLTGGLAHDFNNLLGVIVGNLDLLGAADISDKLKKRVDVALGAALRGANLTRALLAVARRQSLTPVRVDLVSHLREMLPLMHTSVGKAIEIVDAIGEGEIAVQVDVGGLDTAVLNLVVNARDAIIGGGTAPGTGRITLNVVARTIGEPSDQQTPETLAPGRYAVISVSDNGSGMSAEQLSRVLEPFFTTKEKGTGLGLAMVYGFCRQSGGDVKLYSEPGWGTVVRLFLPVLGGKSAQEQATGSVEMQTPGGSERILLVDDETGLLDVASHWLEDLGYTVSAFEDPLAAANALQTETFDLIATDLVMPSMNGYRLAALARSLSPGIGVLYMSGFAAPSIASDASIDAELLEKPFMRSTFAQAVRRAIESAPAANRSDVTGAGS